jgi:membrane protease YdiL (CAAX protease family)
MAVNREPPGPSWRALAVGAVLAVCLFVALFADRRPGLLDFWTRMMLTVTFLSLFAVLTDGGLRTRIRLDFGRNVLGEAVLGLLSAGFLYGIFAAGRFLALRILPFAAQEIGSVYLLKEGSGLVRIGLLLAFFIGPGEELFWRGFLQAGAAARLGAWPGLLLTVLLYALVHAATGNIMLVLAAGTGGLFWGFLFLRSKSLLLVAVSHATWDVLVFVLFPLS